VDSALCGIARSFTFREKSLRKVTKITKFCKNEIFHENENFVRKKLAHFRLIFAFRENEKTRFRFDPSLFSSSNLIEYLREFEFVCKTVLVNESGNPGVQFNEEKKPRVENLVTLSL
jgi:hypothetical protein